MDKILGQDQYDKSGFLVGPATEDDIDKAGREIDILRAIHGDTQETVEQLGRIADGLGQLPIGQAPVTPAARVVGEPGGDEPRPMLLHAAPAEPGDEGRGSRRQAAAPALTAQESPAAPAQSAADLSAVTTVSVQLPSFSEPAAAPVPAAPADPGRIPLPPTGEPAIADPQVAAAEKKAREGKQRDQERQSNGRFGSGAPADAGNDSREGRSSEALAAASESLKNAARGMADGADNIDPSVQAAKEVSAVVSPVLGVFKPLAGLFGFKRASPEEKRHRTDVMWYRRIWGALKDDKGKSRMGLILTGLMAALGMLLAPIKALARMTGLLRGMAALGGLLKAAGGLMGRRGAAGRRGRDGRSPRAEAGSRRTERSRTGRAEARERREHARGADVRGERAANGKGAKGTESTISTKAPGKVGGMAGRMAKGLARRIPFLGALLGLGAVASTAMADDDPNASPEQRQQAKAERYGTYGSVAGGMIGGILGMIGGPAGAILGGMLGEQLGEMVGNWLATVDLSAMVRTVSSAFTDLAGAASDQVGKAFDYVRGKWDGLISSATSALTGMADWAKEKWSAVTEKLADLRDTFADKVSSAKQAVSDGATSIKDAGQNVLNKVTFGHYTGGSNARKDELIKAMDAGGITDPKSKAALMANVDHESMGFTRSEENLNYSGKRLQETFPKYYKDAESARADAGNPEAIANRVYGGRMGNTDPGDGFKYRGRGDIQLTGKAQYEAMGKKLGVDLVNNPELASDPKYSAQIAVQHWKDSGANAAAAQGDITGARKKTNGGTNGLADVEAKYGNYLEQAQAGDLTPTRRADEVRVAAPAGATAAIADTMAKVKGQPPAPGAAAAPAQATTGKPLGMIPITNMHAAPANAAPATGVPGTVPSPKLATAAPVPLPMAPLPSYSAPAADASAVKVPSTPSVAKPMLGGSSKAPPPAQTPMILSQDLEDRRIAHAATGGLGGSGIARM